MNASRNLAIREGFANEDERRKRLGQYFTGGQLARLLAELAAAGDAQSVIDPMAGSGDMLVACGRNSPQKRVFGAVEIDPIAAATCSERAPWAVSVLGSAFDAATLSMLPARRWDLVITNPPYVRYQSLAKSAGSKFSLPSGVEVRNGLLSVLGECDSLDSEDRALFRELVSGYSGLADLAVPSWILCAALCAPGGTLALVLPESWLSRDYASVVQYLLLRWFRIKYVVEDAHAVWFDDAQVKTTLLVAERTDRKESAFGPFGNESFLRLRVYGSAKGENSIVGRMFSDSSENPDHLFARMAAELIATGKGMRTEMLEADFVPYSVIADNLKSACGRQKWLPKVETSPRLRIGPVAYSVPPPLAAWLSFSGSVPRLTTLERVGISVGQGLRTGANEFFYVDAVSVSERETGIEASRTLDRMAATVPSGLALPALRKQSELPDGLVVTAEDLAGRVLVIGTCALPEDVVRGGSGGSVYAAMPEGLARIVRKAAVADFKGKRIYELSAVATNVRSGNQAKGGMPRFWYMLPDLAPRHRPDLIVPRVNSETPKAYLNAGRKAVIDANFSTLWTEGGGPADPWALLALLNSSWCAAALELSASVMGGGALKVEATHLRRLPVPDLPPEGWRRIAALGREMAQGAQGAKEAADSAVAAAVLGRMPKEYELLALSELAENARIRRARHRKYDKK